MAMFRGWSHALGALRLTFERVFCFCGFSYLLLLLLLLLLRLDSACVLLQLIVHASSRLEALNSLRKALREFQVVGLPTNLDFCERVAGHQAFERGSVTTAFLEEHGDEVVPSPEATPPPPHAVVLASVAVMLEEVRSLCRS